MREAGAVIELTSLFIGSSAARRARHRSRCAVPRDARRPARDVPRRRPARGRLRRDPRRRRTGRRGVGAGADASASRRPAGTDLRGSVEGRPGRVLHGLARDDGDYMAPPDIEAGTAPVEGIERGHRRRRRRPAVHGPGPAALPGRAPLRGRRAGRRRGSRGRAGSRRCSRAAPTTGWRNLAEVSMAFNPSGRVCGVAMETESALGTAHIALGNSDRVRRHRGRGRASRLCDA